MPKNRNVMQTTEVILKLLGAPLKKLKNKKHTGELNFENILFYQIYSKYCHFNI